MGCGKPLTGAKPSEGGLFFCSASFGSPDDGPAGPSDEECALTGAASGTLPAAEGSSGVAIDF